MALKPINPPKLAAPSSRYSQGVLAPANARWLHLSGQFGVDEDGVLQQGFPGQMAQAMRNVFAVLAAAQMERSDLVKLTVFATDAGPETVAAYRTIRDQMLGDHAPAALFAAVSAFAHPDYLVEIDAVAAAV